MESANVSARASNRIMIAVHLTATGGTKNKALLKVAKAKISGNACKLVSLLHLFSSIVYFSGSLALT